MRKKIFLTSSALITGFLFIQSCSLPKDTLINKNTIPICSMEESNQFDFVKSKMEGLLISNPTNEDIGYPMALWTGYKKYYWKPVNGKKWVACGVLNAFSIYDGQRGFPPFGNDSHEDEYDWNLNIIPSPDFNDIIDHPKTLTQNTSDWKRCKNGDRFYDCFQAEITPDETLYDNIWFPNQVFDPLKLSWRQPDPIALNQNVCVYGAWVQDGNHDWRPEIHPTEAIWWRNKEQGKDEFFVFGIQDDSNRYDEPDDFVFDNDFGLGWKPWAKPPIVTQIKIPFEYDGKYTDHPVITITELKAHNLVLLPDGEFGDTDSGTNHQLKFQDKRYIDITQASNVLVEVNEQVPLHGVLGVRFSDICKKENGNIIGYVQVTTAYGKDVTGNEGYHVLKITVDYPKSLVELPVIKADSN